MAFNDDYAVFLENIEQTITARDQEEYLVENPGPYPPQPDPSYAELLPVAAAQFKTMLADGGTTVHAAALTTGTSGGGLGRATLTYPAMTTPVVVVSVQDATQDNTYYQCCVESAGSTSATVRVTSAAGVTLLGIPVLQIPALAGGVTVYVMAYDAG